MKLYTKVSPNIAYIRPEYTDLKTRWDLIRHCLAGEEVVKEKGDIYLPRPNPTDLSTENKARYEQYKQRAVFYNVTGRTANGLVGMVFAEDLRTELPAIMEVMEKDVDGGGVSLQQQVQRVLAYVLGYGRVGLLVDYPQTEAPATQKDLAEAKVRPTISMVEPWDVVNWRTTTQGGITKLSLVVITEQYVTDDDGFEEEYAPQWRVLRLDEEGLYVMEEYIEDPNNDGYYILKPISEKGVAQYMPTDSSGKRLDYVPFIFLGAANNDPQPDLPPLFDLAALNIAHYRNSADYEEAVYVTGQPTPYLAGLTEDWVKDVLKGSVQLGSRTAIPLPVGGTAGLLQVQPNILPFEAMGHKERQMVSLGAKLVEQKTVQRTATEAGQDNVVEVSVLATIANNVSNGYDVALKWALNFLNSTDGAEPEVELNTDFSPARMTAQERQQLIAEWVAGAIVFEEMRAALRRSGVATLDDEEAKTLLEEEALLKPIESTPIQDPDVDPAEPATPPTE